MSSRVAVRPGIVPALIAASALAGCGKAPEAVQRSESMPAYDIAPIAEPQPPGIVAPGSVPPTTGGAATLAPIAVSAPQMAYSYRYRFRLPLEAIGRAQDAHVALCDRLGPARCQVLALSSGGGEGERSDASLKLRVASAMARRFGRELQAAVAEAGGRSVSSGIAAEDVSKQIVDTEARLRQRTLLVERLTAILRTRNGKVSELVEAERSVAAAQEEIDQAKGWLTELRGRVAMSTIDVGYETAAIDPAPQGSALGDAMRQSSGAFVSGLGALAAMLILLAPWALLGGIGALAWRWWLRRRRRDETGGEPPA